MITVWTNQNAVRLHQLSDDPQDGTPDEQVAYLSTIEMFHGWRCVSQDYQGPAPENSQGWRWDGSEIVEVTPVPTSVTPRQVRLLLLQQGLLDEVEAMIATQDRATKITWEFAEEFRRDNPLLTSLAANLGLTEQQIDQFFIAASAL